MGEKNHILSVFLVLTLIIITSTNVSAAESRAITQGTNKGSEAIAYYPDTINVLEPFKINIQIPNEEFRQKIEYISISGCSIPFENAIGLKKSDPAIISRNKYAYKGEEKLTLEVTMINTGAISGVGYADGTWSLYSCDINFKGKEIDYVDYLNIRVDFYPYTYGIKNLASGFVMVKEDVHGFSRSYERKGGADEVTFYSKLKDYEEDIDNYYTYDELKTPIISSWKNAADFSVEQLTLNGKPAVFMHKCTTNGYKDKFRGDCILYGHILMPVGPVELEMRARQITYVPSESDMYVVIDNWKTEFLAMLESVYFESKGKTSDFIIDETDDNECGNCKEGFTCGACGTCIKETKAYEPGQITVEVENKITQSATTIDNALESQAIFRVYPQMKLTTYSGKEINYCELKAPGLKGTITATMTSLDAYSGFTTGFATDERELTSSCELKLEESKPYCAFIVQANDKKKFMANASDIKQDFEFSTLIQTTTAKDTKTLTLKAPKFAIKLHSRRSEVQQGSNGVLEVSTSGATTKNVIIKASLLGPGGIGLESKSLTDTWVLKSVGSGEIVKIGYAAPTMGNFDIGSELQSLSMVNLQKAAAKQIAEDAFIAYGGQYVSNVDALVKTGEYSAKMGQLTEAFKLANGAKTIRGVNDGMPGLTEEVGDAMGVNEGKKEAGWLEKGADVGIAGISIAQTTVSVITFIPNQLPGVSKLTAGVQTAFSAATNIWKANLKYISKSEKIERAKELYYPAVIVVTAQDISGWTTQEMHVFKISYQQID